MWKVKQGEEKNQMCHYLQMKNKTATRTTGAFLTDQNGVSGNLIAYITVASYTTRLSRLTAPFWKRGEKENKCWRRKVFFFWNILKIISQWTVSLLMWRNSGVLEQSAFLFQLQKRLTHLLSFPSWSSLRRFSQLILSCLVLSFRASQSWTVYQTKSWSMTHAGSEEPACPDRTSLANCCLSFNLRQRQLVNK